MASLEAVCEDGGLKFAIQIVERVIGTILNQSDSTDTATATAVGQTLANVLARVLPSSSGTFPMLEAAKQTCLAVCLQQPPPGEDGLEETVLKVTSGTDDPIFRVFHSSPVGQALFDLVESKNEKLKLAKDATTCLIECQTTMDSLADTFQPYFEGQNIPMQDGAMCGAIAELTTCCGKFVAGLDAAGSVPDAVSASLEALATKLSKALVDRTVGFMAVPLKTLMKNSDHKLMLDDGVWLWSQTLNHKISEIMQVGIGRIYERLRSVGKLPQVLATYFERIDSLLDIAHGSDRRR